MKTLLATRSTYSLLQGLMSIETLCKLAKERGYEAVCLSDNGVLFGASSFFKTSLKYGLKPLLGLEINIQFDGEEQFFVIAKNNQGFKELITLSSMINDQGLSNEEFIKNTKNCTVIYSTESSSIEVAMLQDDLKECLSKIRNYQQYFREFVVGFSMQQSSLFKHKNTMLMNQLDNNNINYVALPKVYYANPQEDYDYKALRAIEKQVSINDKTLISQPYRYLLEYQELESIYPPKSVRVAADIGRTHTVDLNAFSTSLPQVRNEFNVSSAVYLSELAKVGLKKRFSNKNAPIEYQQRLDFELDVITNMNYQDYFLIVYDFVLFAKKNGISVGPGRGSGAASLVAYCLGITNIDPLEHNLIFERFLNPERISMPDFDIDFSDKRRDEVIEYVRHKYGENHVAHIITFSTLSQKQVIRDVGKILQKDTKIIESISKNLVNQPKGTLKESIQTSGKLREILNTRDDAKQIMDLSLRLEGIPRQSSMHAAGIVISRKPLQEVIATIRLDNGALSTQYTMEYLEEMGLIKMDFLGLRNLSIIDDIVEQIHKENSSFDINKIPLEDSKTYRLVASGYTLGIFQLESHGMSELIKQVVPKIFMDIVDTIALYRPGPMQFRNEYIRNRNNPKDVRYLHPDLMMITKSTNGIMIYQEQIMEVARRFAGFSYGRADILRKAMSKKDMNEMKSMKQEFLIGTQKNGYTVELANQLWDYTENFASYGFNKAHSVSYGLIAYQMAYLKQNYSLFFYKALLSSGVGSSRKLKETLDECQKRNITLLGVSINHSYSDFSLEKGAIRLCLSMVKSIGLLTANQIVKNRYEKGLFKDFFDCVARLNVIKLTVPQFESLIYAGAFDEFKLSRQTMLATLADALVYAAIVKVELEQKTLLNYDLVSKPLITTVKDNKTYLSSKEKDVLGFHFSFHPLLDFRIKYPDIKETILDVNVGSGVFRFLAMISSVKEIKTKKGELMAFVKVEDEKDSLEMVVFSKEYRLYQSDLNRFNCVIIEGNQQDNRNLILKSLHVLSKGESE